jgi:RNA polymerase-binding transcription factor DksA
MTSDHQMTLDLRASTLPDVEIRLARLQEDREAQLQATPPNTGDLAVAAYRANLEANLRNIRVARQRLATGDYGTCIGCNGEIPAERLQLRPWALTCAACPSRD